jgi:hypothetical protein
MVVVSGAARRPAEEVQSLLDALLHALDIATAGDEADHTFVRTARERLAAFKTWVERSTGSDMPALRALAPACAALDDTTPALRRCAEAIGRASPHLHWYLRPDEGPEAASFAAGHANALIIGPPTGRSGLEQPADVIVGLSVMAPGVTYPVHRHPPDELYLVLSEGEWWREETGWFRPGIGGTVRNSPGVRHAMRSGDRPLLAGWILLS